MSDDFEKFKNFTLFKIYATDRERDELFSHPAFWIPTIVFMVFGILAVIFL